MVFNIGDFSVTGSNEDVDILISGLTVVEVVLVLSLVRSVPSYDKRGRFVDGFVDGPPSGFSGGSVILAMGVLELAV